MNYELKESPFEGSAAKRWYIRSEQPATFITDNMTYSEALKVAKAMSQLGHIVRRTT